MGLKIYESGIPGQTVGQIVFDPVISGSRRVGRYSTASPEKQRFLESLGFQALGDGGPSSSVASSGGVDALPTPPGALAITGLEYVKLYLADFEDELSAVYRLGKDLMMATGSRKLFRFTQDATAGKKMELAKFLDANPELKKTHPRVLEKYNASPPRRVGVPANQDQGSSTAPTA